MPASDKHVLDYEGLQYFKSKIYSDLKTINGAAITGGGNLSLVVANTAITGATKCKITYDSKGLVTRGADLAASDIPELAASKITSGTFDTARIPTLAISKISGLQSALDAKYVKPTGGIPASDLAGLEISNISGLQSALNSKYEKPTAGIPASDLAESYILASARNAANGVAPLDPNSKIPLENLPDAILGASEQGGVVTYASNDISISLNSNAAALLATTAGTKTWAQLAALLYANQVKGTGLYFIFDNDVSSFDFAINGVSNVITDIQVGDWIIYNGGTEIRKIENVDAVKSVQIQGTASVISSSISTAQTGIVSTVLNLIAGHGDVVNPYGSKTANYILAAPNGSNGVPSFRALVSDDIPSLPISKITDLQTSLNNKSLIRKTIPAIEEWVAKTWNGFIDFDGQRIWTDGENIYYSSSSNQYVLDKATSTWNVKTWNGLTSFNGSYIWIDGENIYYSNFSNQYVLDKATSTWNVKTWNGFTDLIGNRIWTDGDNIYYSDGSNQYVLDKATSTWNVKTWNGLTSFNAWSIWTDGENIYYSSGSNQYVLDKATSTWNVKTWNGLTSFNAWSIWTDGENIYYSSGSNQYVLDKATSTWVAKTWNGLTSFDGSYIWIDGNNFYMSNYSSQYILNKQEASTENIPVADFTVDGSTLILEWL